MWTSLSRDREKVLRTSLEESDLKRGLPSPPQDALLRAIFSAPSTTEAWGDWKKRYSVEDSDVYRLLPALYGRLAEEGVEGGQYLRGVSRHCYASWSVQRMAAERIFSVLEKEGMPVLAMKGLAVSERLGGARRHMCDVDVLVPPGRAKEAIGTVLRGGWESESGIDREGLEASVGSVHARGFRKGRLSFDLHWNSVHQDKSWAFDEPVWSRSSGDGLRHPDVTDLVLQVAMHGMRWDSRSHAWPLDVLNLIGHAGSVNWGQILSTAVRRRLVVQAKVLIRVVESYIPGTVSEEVRAAAEAASVSPLEVLEHRGVTGSRRGPPRATEVMAARLMSEIRRSSPDQVKQDVDLTALTGLVFGREPPSTL